MTAVADEVHVAERFIYARLIQHPPLAGLVGTRVWRDVAPDSLVPNVDPTYPYIVFTLISAEDAFALGGDIIWANCLWQIEYWSKTNDSAVIAQGAALIKAALHLASGPMTGTTYGSGLVVTTYRERSLRLTPDIEGQDIWRRGGGEYRQLVTAT